MNDCCANSRPLANHHKKNLEIALIGNPNVGKTSIFNALAGLNQKVGNWPGVTVEKKTGQFQSGDQHFTLVDLPGIYDFSSLSLDEQISQQYLLNTTPDRVIFVADATKLSRSLFLVLQLLEMQLPVILVLNMYDMAEKKGVLLDTKKISEILHIPVLTTNAKKGQGLEELKCLLGTPLPTASPFKPTYYQNPKDTFLEEKISELENLLQNTPFAPKKRYIAIEMLEGHLEAPAFLKPDSLEQFEQISKALAKRYKETPDILITEKRYAFAQGITNEVMKNILPYEKKLDISSKLDKIFTHPLLGIPIFFGILFLLFEAVFTFGNPLADLSGEFFDFLSATLKLKMGESLFSSFLTDGLLSGVGSVLSLLPNIIIMFLLLSILEDSGYLSRAAFLMDHYMHRLGLHGKSFIPLILGFGCNVPAIMSTRSIDSEKDRLITILINPFVSCSARLPVYILFTGIFFESYQGLVVFSLYLLGILTAIFSARLFKKFFFPGKSLPLIMELPFYQVPSLYKLVLHMWDRSKVYVKKAGTIILAGSALVWLLSALPFGTEYAGPESVIARLGNVISPLFAPAGFGFWQAAVALIFGIVAKETVVSTLSTLFAGIGPLTMALAAPGFFTPLSAYAFLIMTLLYIPCLSTMAVIKQEAGLKWMGFSLFYSFLVGWLGAVLVYQIGSLF